MDYNTSFRLDFDYFFFEITLLRKTIKFKTEIFVAYRLTNPIFHKSRNGHMMPKLLMNFKKVIYLTPNMMVIWNLPYIH